ncbi:unnamed protein product [Cylicocyclus nassatus]|uniref:Uncharacterized protein n=1 Tax=Cylicocyclus nassatus TaxID=53992 RepID=A0AA36M6M4_CYLNA|nr:unnamed protein product [Cylicocyclus nassatus]
MAASNKRKAASSPVPKQRKFGDKITLHCNDEKKTPRRKTAKGGKSKLASRKRKVSSPSLKENQYAVAFIPECAPTHSNADDPNVSSEAPTIFDKKLQLPEVRMVGRLNPLRCQPRLTDEPIDLEAYTKRHEKHEKEEKQILRRDRIWQNEVRYRSRLLRLQQTPPPFRDFRIVVMRKARNVK